VSRAAFGEASRVRAHSSKKYSDQDVVRDTDAVVIIGIQIRD
jgi:hypothetical protein